MSFPQESTAYPEASQASTALVLGIVGLVCCQILGIVAWIMANNELEAIKEGPPQPAERRHGHRRTDHRDHRHGASRARDHRADRRDHRRCLASDPLVRGVLAGGHVPLTRAWRDRLVFAAPLAVLGLLASIRPEDDGVTVCPFALLTGMACPGCGMTRAASSLIRGDSDYRPRLPPTGAVDRPVVRSEDGRGSCLRRSGRVEPLPTRWVNTILIGTGIMLLGVWAARLLSGTLPPV